MGVPTFLMIALPILNWSGFFSAKDASIWLNTKMARRDLENRRYFNAERRFYHVYWRIKDIKKGDLDKRFMSIPEDDIADWQTRRGMAFVSLIVSIFSEEYEHSYKRIKGLIEAFSQYYYEKEEYYLKRHLMDPKGDTRYLMALLSLRVGGKDDATNGLKQALLSANFYDIRDAKTPKEKDRLLWKIACLRNIFFDLTSQKEITEDDWKAIGRDPEIRNIKNLENLKILLSLPQLKAIMEGFKSGLPIPIRKRLDGTKINRYRPKSDIEADFVMKIYSAFWLYIWAGLPISLLIIVLVLFVLFISFMLKDRGPKLRLFGNFIERFPSIVNECLPQILWLFLISRVLILAEDPKYYYIWLFTIAFTFSPTIIEQLGSKITLLRSSGFIQAEIVAGENSFIIFWRDIVWKYCFPLLMTHSIYLLTSIISMESCMVFLAKVEGRTSSLAVMFLDYYQPARFEENIRGFFESLPIQFWLLFVVILSVVITLRNLGKRIEGMIR